MVNEFSRTELLLGAEAIDQLKNTKVMVLGVGGVGSHCIEALARCGVGKLILVDNDTVSLTNINRQSIAYHSTVGQFKTKVMEARIKDICPETEVVTYEMFVLPENIDELFQERPDYIVDAIDTVTAKLVLAEKAGEYQIPIISCMGTGNKLDPSRFEITDISKTSVCPLAKVMRTELRKRGLKKIKVLYSKEKPVKNQADHGERKGGTDRPVPGSISFVPSVAGLMIAGEVVRDILVLPKKK